MANRKKIITSNYVFNAFFGSYDVVIDEAGRISIPYQFIDVLRVYYNNDGLKLFMMPDLYTDSIRIFPKTIFEETQLPYLLNMEDYGQEQVSSKLYLMGLTDMQEIDSYGRIRIGCDLLKSAKIDIKGGNTGENKTKNLSVIGQGKYFVVMPKTPYADILNHKDAKAIASKYFKPGFKASKPVAADTDKQDFENSDNN